MACIKIDAAQGLVQMMHTTLGCCVHSLCQFSSMESSLLPAKKADSYTCIISCISPILQNISQSLTVQHEITADEQLLIQPRHEKTCLRGLRPGKTPTGLLSYRD